MQKGDSFYTVCSPAQVEVPGNIYISYLINIIITHKKEKKYFPCNFNLPLGNTNSFITTLYYIVNNPHPMLEGKGINTPSFIFYCAIITFINYYHKILQTIQ